MSVYARTAAGNEAALNPHSELPRKLRTLLISIDGRTKLETYVSTLSSFGDVNALIESLLQAGLIDIRPASATVASLAEERLGGTTNIGGDSGWASTESGLTHWQAEQAGTRSHTQVDDVASWSQFQQPPAAPAPSFRPPAIQSATTAHYQLRNAIALMSDFVTQHMPMESLELVLTLEGLTSVEQIVASLKGYEALIIHLGKPARRHMAELRRLLSSS